MEVDKIKNLDELIKKYHGQDVQIVDKKMSYLTAPGENYLSDIFKLDVKIKNKNGSQSIEHYVAKSVLIDPEMPPDMNIIIFKNEILFYTTVIPTIQQFAKEHGLQNMDIFPEMIAARFNLKDKGEPDENAALIMENLVEKGYTNADRHKSFDINGIKLILSDLAIFHAVPLAIRIQKPKLFEENIAEICKPHPPPGHGDDKMKPSSRPPHPLPGKGDDKMKLSFPPPHPPPGNGDDKIKPSSPPAHPPSGNGDDRRKPPPLVPLLIQVAKEDPFCRNHIDKLEKFVKDMEGKMHEKFTSKPDYSSPFVTLVHNDMWLNNTMQLCKEGQYIKNKFVDFQTCSVDEPLGDLIFLIFSSVDFPTLENHFDYLLMFYHECFIKTLEYCKCDVAPFAYNKFMAKIKDAFLSTFLQIMMMNFMVVYSKKGEKTGPFKLKEMKTSDLHPIAKKKFVFLFKKIVENEWI